MYTAASSRVRVDGVCSTVISVHSGVAQGCPLSPLQYAVFIDSVLDDLYAAAPLDAIQVGKAERRRPWRGPPVR